MIFLKGLEIEVDVVELRDVCVSLSVCIYVLRCTDGCGVVFERVCRACVFILNHSLTIVWGEVVLSD